MRWPTVYLAGPIGGCSAVEANDWRTHCMDFLDDYNITAVSPLRCEPIIGQRYDISGNSNDPKVGSARAIGSKNIFDVRHCDMTLVYLPRELNERKPSYGTIIELGWAHMLGKPTVVVSDDPAVLGHPVIGSCAGWLLDDLDEGLEVVAGILAVYA